MGARLAGAQATRVATWWGALGRMIERFVSGWGRRGWPRGERNKRPRRGGGLPCGTLAVRRHAASPCDGGGGAARDCRAPAGRWARSVTSLNLRRPALRVRAADGTVVSARRP